MIEPVMTRLRDDIDEHPSSPESVPETTLILFKFLYFLTKTRGFKTIGKVNSQMLDFFHL